jgi:hypothetical protein
MFEITAKSLSCAVVAGEKADVYSFVKEGGQWYIDLPEYLAGGRRKADLETVMGAAAVLNFFANGKPNVSMIISTQTPPVAYTGRIDKHARRWPGMIV